MRFLLSTSISDIPGWFASVRNPSPQLCNIPSDYLRAICKLIINCCKTIDSLLKGTWNSGRSFLMDIFWILLASDSLSLLMIGIPSSRWPVGLCRELPTELSSHLPTRILGEHMVSILTIDHGIKEPAWLVSSNSWYQSHNIETWWVPQLIIRLNTIRTTFLIPYWH